MPFALDYVQHVGQRCIQLSMRWLPPKYVAVLSWYGIEQVADDITIPDRANADDAVVAERESTRFHPNTMRKFSAEAVDHWVAGDYDHFIEGAEQ